MPFSSRRSQLFSSFQAFTERLFSQIDQFTTKINDLKGVHLFGYAGCDGKEYPMADENGIIQVSSGVSKSKDLSAASRNASGSLDVVFTDGCILYSCLVKTQLATATNVFIRVFDDQGTPILAYSLGENIGTNQQTTYYPAKALNAGATAGINLESCPIVIPPGWKLSMGFGGGASSYFDYNYTAFALNR